MTMIKVLLIMQMQSLCGSVFVICGPCGGGKTTIVKEIKQQYPRICRLVSSTTRPARDGEEEGEDFNFISRNEFIEKQNNHIFLVTKEINQVLYGMPYPLEGTPQIAIVDTESALKIKAILKNQAKLIFIYAPIEILNNRMESRGGLSDDALQKRQAHNFKEFELFEENQDSFALTVKNIELNQAVDTVKNFIGNEALKK